MVVTIEFTNGRMCEYNTSTFCAPDPWSETRVGRPVVACELDLRLDLLMSDGSLRLDVIRHALRPEGGSVELEEYEGADKRHPTVTVAARIPTVSLTLASKKEMDEAAVIYVSSAGAHKPVAWRQGSGDGEGAPGWVINGVKFESLRRLYYSDSIMSSTSMQAAKLFRYLRNSLPAEIGEEAIAETIGFPLGAIKEVMANEAANATAVIKEKDETTGKDDASSVAADATGSSPSMFNETAPLIDPGEYADDEDDEDDGE